MAILRSKIYNFVKTKKIFITPLIIIFVFGYWVYGKYFNLTDAERFKKELATAIDAVSRHMILPEGDEPMLATVTDAEALIKQQTFFIGAVNGDQLLLFPKNRKAVLWSPERKLIVNVGPIEQQQAVDKFQEVPTPQALEDLDENEPDVLGGENN